MSVLCINKILNIFEFDNEYITPRNKQRNRNCDRTRSFDRLKDPSKYLYKTRMCCKERCSKKGCPFAHTVLELRKVKCFFGSNCKFLKTGKCKLEH